MLKFSLVAFILTWFMNFPVLKRVYDTSVYSEFVDFWKARGILYDGMFLTNSMIFFFVLKRLRMYKYMALACFISIVTAGSLFDKAFFGIADYMYSDIVLIVSGVIVAVIIYRRNERRNTEFIH